MFFTGRGTLMSDFLATVLALAFALVVCLLALQAILSPWLRFRRPPAGTISPRDEKPLTRAAHSRDTTPVHTA